MLEDLATTLQQILSKLQKLDTIESAIKSIEVNLQNLETRTQCLESSESTAKQERGQLNERIQSTKDQVNDRMKEVKEKQDFCSRRWERCIRKTYTWRLIPDARISNSWILRKERYQQISEMLCQFLEQDLGYKDARKAKIQRVQGKERRTTTHTSLLFKL